MSLSALTSWLLLSASLVWPNPGTLDNKKIQWTIVSSNPVTELIHPDEHREICHDQATRLSGEILEIAMRVLKYSLSQPQSVTIHLQKVPASQHYEIQAILRYPDWQKHTQNKWFTDIMDMHPAAPIQSVSLRLDAVLGRHFTDATCWKLWD